MSCPDCVVEAGSARLDLVSQTFTNTDWRPIALTRLEAKLLAFLMRNAWRAVSRHEILDVLGIRRHGSNVVDVYINYLRRKLGDEAIETLRGDGYRFNAEAGS